MAKDQENENKRLLKQAYKEALHNDRPAVLFKV